MEAGFLLSLSSSSFDLLTTLLVLNVDSNLTCLHLLTALGMVQYHHSSAICVSTRLIVLYKSSSSSSRRRRCRRRRASVILQTQSPMRCQYIRPPVAMCYCRRSVVCYCRPSTLEQSTCWRSVCLVTHNISSKA